MAVGFDWAITVFTIHATITEQYARVLIIWLHLIRHAGDNRENSFNVSIRELCFMCLNLVFPPQCSIASSQVGTEQWLP